MRGRRVWRAARAALALVLAAAATAAEAATLLVTDSAGRDLMIVDEWAGIQGRIEAGAMPWGVAIGRDRLAYVATAEGVAIVDPEARRRVALVPYQSAVELPVAAFFDGRPGGMGIAAAPDGRFVYVGVHDARGAAHVEILDTIGRRMVGRTAVSSRPFDVLVARHGGAVYAVDHDSFSVTVIEPPDRLARVLPVAPDGRGVYDKPHYAVEAPDGRLVLPFPRSLALLDPHDGRITTWRLRAGTHLHGVALAPDGRTAVIVGSGPAGSAQGPPSLTVIDILNGQGFIHPLPRGYERIAVAADGRRAFLTGGITLGMPAGVVSVVEIATGLWRDIPVPGRPLDVRIWRD